MQYFQKEQQEKFNKSICENQMFSKNCDKKKTINEDGFFKHYDSEAL